MIHLHSLSVCVNFRPVFDIVLQPTTPLCESSLDEWLRLAEFTEVNSTVAFSGCSLCGAHVQFCSLKGKAEVLSTKHITHCSYGSAVDDTVMITYGTQTEHEVFELPPTVSQGLQPSHWILRLFFFYQKMYTSVTSKYLMLMMKTNKKQWILDVAVKH